jgi:hypothetical protein
MALIVGRSRRGVNENPAALANRADQVHFGGRRVE